MPEFEFRPLPPKLGTASSETEPRPEPDRRISRMQARAEQRRTDRHDAVQTWTEKRRARREDRQDARADRRARRDESRTDRSQQYQRAKNLIAAFGRRTLIAGPILAPMAVAWTGQSQFATRILGWPFIASIVYAAAYELATAYWAWLYHQARSDGDHGWEYRAATWIFAFGAGLQQWWHYSDHWHATPRSVTYSVMSGSGVLMWEGYARLIHRRKLRRDGMLAAVRPRIGPARWLRYPVHSWTAWSLAVLEGHRTLDAAWTAAEAQLRSTRAARSERAQRQQSKPAVRTGQPQTAGPGPAVRTERTTPAVQAGPTVDLAKHKQVKPGPVQAPRTGPDRAEVDLVLTDVEQEAIDRLRSTGRSISKRSIADVVRNELDQSIGSDRAAIIARHFRTLKAA